jgi:hypothetical protein
MTPRPRSEGAPRDALEDQRARDGRDYEETVSPAGVGVVGVVVDV